MVANKKEVCGMCVAQRSGWGAGVMSCGCPSGNHRNIMDAAHWEFLQEGQD